MFDTFEDVESKYKALALVASAAGVVVLLSALLASNDSSSSPKSSEIITQEVPSDESTLIPDENTATDSDATSEWREVKAIENTSDALEMGIYYDVPLDSDRQVEILQFAKRAFQELCTLENGETISEHSNSVEALFQDFEAYRNLVELYVKPADFQTCITTGYGIFAYKSPPNEAYQIYVTGYRNRTLDGTLTESELLVNMIIVFDDSETYKISQILPAG